MIFLFLASRWKVGSQLQWSPPDRTFRAVNGQFIIFIVFNQNTTPKIFHFFVMLATQTVVIDFEGFRFFNQPFTVKELFSQCFGYNDTILLEPPFPIHLVSVKAQKVYAWVTNNIHGLNWDSGNYDYLFLYCFFLSL